MHALWLCEWWNHTPTDNIQIVEGTFSKKPRSWNVSVCTLWREYKWKIGTTRFPVNGARNCSGLIPMYELAHYNYLWWCDLYESKKIMSLTDSSSERTVYIIHLNVLSVNHFERISVYVYGFGIFGACNKMIDICIAYLTVNYWVNLIGNDSRVVDPISPYRSL